MTYQWYRNGQPISGATGKSLQISDVNSSQHNGTYSFTVSNDFGSVESQSVQLEVNSTRLYHTVPSASNMEMIWVEPGTFTMGQAGYETVHQVTLTQGYYLGKFEVAQAQYEAVMTGNSQGLNAKPSRWLNNDQRPVEKVSWEIRWSFSRLSINWSRQPVGYPRDGNMYFPPRLSGNTPAGQVRLRFIPGGMISIPPMPIITGMVIVPLEMIPIKPLMLGNMHPIPGAFLICMVMSRNGFMIGMQLILVALEPILPDRHRARFGVFRGGSWSTTGRTCVRLKRGNPTPVHRLSTLGFRVGFKSNS